MSLLPHFPPCRLFLLKGSHSLLGVDRFMSEARAIVNLIGNGIATIVVSKSEKEFDEKQSERAVLDLEGASKTA